MLFFVPCFFLIWRYVKRDAATDAATAPPTIAPLPFTESKTPASLEAAALASSDVNISNVYKTLPRKTPCTVSLMSVMPSPLTSRFFDSLTAGDVDSDGDLDIVAGGGLSGAFLEVFENPGTGNKDLASWPLHKSYTTFLKLR